MLHIIAHQLGDDVPGLLALVRRPVARVDALEHERAQLQQRVPLVRLHGDLVAVHRLADDAFDHGVDALAMRVAQHADGMHRQILALEHARADGVVDVVVDVGDAVRQMHAAALQRLRAHLSGVVLDAVAHLPRQVEAVAAVFQHLDHAAALHPVLKAALDDAVERILARVPERRVPEVVPHRDGLGQILVEPQRARQRAGHLRDLQRVRQARAVVIALRGEKDLRLALEPPEGLAVEDTVAVALELRAHVVRGNRPLPALRLAAEHSKRAERLPLLCLQPFSDRHGAASLSAYSRMLALLSEIRHFF